MANHAMNPGMIRSFRTALCLALCCMLALSVTSADESGATDRVSGIADELTRVIQDGIDLDSVVGSQLAVGTRERLVVSRQFGAIAPGSDRPVDDQTLFCIGSCSKPIVSACVMALVDDGTLTLDDPIDLWLTQFTDLKDESGHPVDRSPTIRELLAHRGGIYSQRRELSREQQRAIRDFRLTLAESVEIIARQPLIAAPGTSFHYSGAGYCVLGRVVERSADADIEDLLQTRLGRPLGWNRTTYFPAADDENVAIGGVGRSNDERQSARVRRDELRLPLVGGSIHSTADESARFAGMILNSGRSGGMQILSDRSISEITRPQYEDGNYGLGWSIELSESGRTAVLSHGGALYAGRSLLFVNLDAGFYAVVHWTLTDPESDDIRTALQRILQSH